MRPASSDVGEDTSPHVFPSGPLLHLQLLPHFSDPLPCDMEGLGHPNSFHKHFLGPCCLASPVVGSLGHPMRNEAQVLLTGNSHFPGVGGR